MIFRDKHSRYLVSARLGDFWSTHLRGSDQERIFKAITGLGSASDIGRQFGRAGSTLIGTQGSGGVWSRTFKESDIRITPAVSSDYPYPALPQSVVVNSADLGSGYYVCIELETDEIPLRLRSTQGTLVNGISFFYNAGFLWFLEDVKHLFPDMVLTAGATFNRTSSFQNYPAGTVGVAKNMDLVVNYLRAKQSPKNLELALAAIIGAPIIRKGGELLQVKEFSPWHYGYEFNDEFIEVFYPHTPLEVGERYNPGTLIGDPVRVTAGSTSDPTWYERVNWPSIGIPLGRITKYPTLFAPNTVVEASIDHTPEDPGSVQGSKGHVRFGLSSETPGEVDQFWDEVWMKETEQGIYLNSIIGAEASAEVPVNPVHVFMQLLGPKAIVIHLNHYYAPTLEPALDFLEQNLPFGSIPIIYVTDIPGLSTESGEWIVTDKGEIIGYE